LKLVEENCARLGHDRCVEQWLYRITGIQHSHFDRILVDAPCSNTGVMRRRVDLRWRISPEEIMRPATNATGFARSGGAETQIRRRSGLQHLQSGTGGKLLNVVKEFLASESEFQARNRTPVAAVCGESVDGARLLRG
jgi:hypothetical protein